MSVLTTAKAGYGVITSPSGTIEFDTATCPHCNRVWVVKSNNPMHKPDLGGFCTLCMKNICPECIGKECVPFEKQLLKYEQSRKLDEAILNAVNIQ